MLMAVGGVSLLALVSLDVLATTLTIGTRAGPFTRRVLGLAWRVLLRLHRRDGAGRLLSTAGVGLLVGTVLIWVVLVWAGWSLIFLGGGRTVLSSEGAPAGVADTVYYVGFTIFTLGVGDFVAATPLWRNLSAVASFNGLVLVTLAITYLLAVVSAVVDRRSLAVRITALGKTPAEIVVGGWAGDRFSDAFVQQLVGLLPAVSAAAEQHLAYPVLHYFHSPSTASAAPVALARLDEAVLLLRAAVAPPARIHSSAVEPVRRALDRWLFAATSTVTGPQDGRPPGLPDTSALRGAGIPLASAAEYLQAAAAAADADRRCRLRAVVEDDGWSWPGS